MSDTPQKPGSAKAPSKEELGEMLVAGDITPAQYLGLSQKQLYEIATMGNNMLKRGDLEKARDIFLGLVAASPYDSVFHVNLAFAYHQLKQLPEALEEYTTSLRLNIANVDALVGRSELYLQEGKLEDALKDILAALKLDPEAKRDTTKRARATLAMLQKKADEALEE
ncbi:tetratricopeptide repeat protein [Hyalangium minutum]|uniref:Tetratricopeptide repeat protein n=1 Tax=Hyalangium minutum TaxID=394096 RepID=A0A085WVQ9_9BACT|nr:tetratricopeptide repeat protein [Hyalangium minutum]KFE71772.1 Tetratricopeptide repeat protein [Hyalangium minutum]